MGLPKCTKTRHQVYYTIGSTYTRMFHLRKNIWLKIYVWSWIILTRNSGPLFAIWSTIISYQSNRSWRWISMSGRLSFYFVFFSSCHSGIIANMSRIQTEDGGSFQWFHKERVKGPKVYMIRQHKEPLGTIVRVAQNFRNWNELKKSLGCGASEPWYEVKIPCLYLEYLRAGDLGSPWENHCQVVCRIDARVVKFTRNLRVVQVRVTNHKSDVKHIQIVPRSPDQDRPIACRCLECWNSSRCVTVHQSDVRRC